MNKVISIITFSFLLMSLCSAQNSLTYEKASAENGIQSGDIKSLDNVTKVNIIYDFKSMVIGAKSVGGDGHISEVDYITKKSEIIEKDDKGKGEEFKKNWEEGKSKSYQVEFERLFNQYATKDIKMTGANNTSDADYNLIVKTTKIEPGYRMGMVKALPYIDAEFIFTDKSGKELVRLFFKSLLPSAVGAPVWMMSKAIEPSYAKAAKKLVEFIEDTRKGRK